MNFTILAVHPLSQDETVCLMRDMLEMITLDHHRFELEVFPYLTMTATEVLFLAAQLGFIEYTTPPLLN
jgi:hypothetical protein